MKNRRPHGRRFYFLYLSTNVGQTKKWPMGQNGCFSKQKMPIRHSIGQNLGKRDKLVGEEIAHGARTYD